MIEYKLERYVITSEGIERVGTLGTGQTFQTLKDMTRPEATLAQDTLTQVYISLLIVISSMCKS